MNEKKQQRMRTVRDQIDLKSHDIQQYASSVELTSDGRISMVNNILGLNYRLESKEVRACFDNDDYRRLSKINQMLTDLRRLAERFEAYSTDYPR